MWMYCSRLFSNVDVVYEGAYIWHSSSELSDALTSLNNSDKLTQQGRQSRAHYERNHSLERLSDSVAKLKNGQSIPDPDRLKFYPRNDVRSFFSLSDHFEADKTAMSVDFEQESELIPIPGVENILFGQSVRLRKIYMWKCPVGLAVSAHWCVDEEPQLAKFVGVHIMDQNGTILAQADHQLRSRREINSRSWRDCFRISNDHLVGANAIGISVYEEPQQTLLIEGGSCDWGNHRLVIPLVAASSALE